MISTRTETINNNVYCAYCGKLLKDNNSGIHIYPEPPVFCMCENAEKEKEIYLQLKKMYEMPMHEDLIEMKVCMYKNKLLGIPNTVVIPV